MKYLSLFAALMLFFSSYCLGQSEVGQESTMNDSLQAADTIGTRKTLNEIRFEGWTDDDWLDNEYICTLRKYMDDYNSGKVSNPALDPYKEQVKGQFVIYNISPYLLGGMFIRVIFFDMPDRVFSSWVYSDVDEEKEVVIGYEFRSIRIEDTKTGMTQEDILQAIKEVPGLKLW